MRDVHLGRIALRLASDGVHPRTCCCRKRSSRSCASLASCSRRLAIRRVRRGARLPLALAVGQAALPRHGVLAVQPGQVLLFDLLKQCTVKWSKCRLGGMRSHRCCEFEFMRCTVIRLMMYAICQTSAHTCKRACCAVAAACSVSGCSCAATASWPCRLASCSAVKPSALRRTRSTAPSAAATKAATGLGRPASAKLYGN